MLNLWGRKTQPVTQQYFELVTLICDFSTVQLCGFWHLAEKDLYRFWNLHDHHSPVISHFVPELCEALTFDLCYKNLQNKSKLAMTFQSWIKAPRAYTCWPHDLDLCLLTTRVLCMQYIRGTSAAYETVAWLSVCSFVEHLCLTILSFCDCYVFNSLSLHLHLQWETCMPNTTPYLTQQAKIGKTDGVKYSTTPYQEAGMSAWPKFTDRKYSPIGSRIQAFDWIFTILQSICLIAHQPAKFQDSQQMCGWVIDGYLSNFFVDF